jgi:hypothetical protein
MKPNKILKKGWVFHAQKELSNLHRGSIELTLKKSFSYMPKYSFKHTFISDLQYFVLLGVFIIILRHTIKSKYQEYSRC